MATHCFGQRMSRVKSTILYHLASIVVVNMLNFITLPFHIRFTKELFGNDHLKIITMINFFETTTLITTIILTISASKKESVIYFIILGTTVCILILDLSFTYKTYDYILQKRTPERLCLRIIVGVYFVFKFFAPFGIIRLGMKFSSVVDGVMVYYIRNTDDIEILVDNSLGSPISCVPPPSYDQCMIESTPPPPYKDVQP